MTFLAKLGSILAKGIAILTGLGPLVQQYAGAKTGAVVNTVVNDLTAVGGVVLNVESVLGAGNGQAKLKAAAPLVANIVKASELISGHKIANETLFNQGVVDLTNAVAEIMNSLSADNLQTSGHVIDVTPLSVTVTPTSAAIPTAAPPAPNPVPVEADPAQTPVQAPVPSAPSVVGHNQ